MPHRLYMTRFHREVSPEEFLEVLGCLRESGCTFLLHRANDAYLNALGVSHQAPETVGREFSSPANYVLGDLIPADDWSELSYIGLRRERKGLPSLRRKRDYSTHLEVGSISISGDHSNMQRIQALAEQKLKVDADEMAWRGRNWFSDQFRELSEKGRARSREFSDAEIRAARLLEDPGIFNLASSVKRAGGMLIGDFLRLSEGRPDVATKLLGSCLVAKSNVLICRKSSKMLALIPTADSAAAMSQSGAVCASCSRPFADEKVDELVILSDAAKDLIDHSNWMAAILCDSLRNLGVDQEDILLEFQEARGGRICRPGWALDYVRAEGSRIRHGRCLWPVGEACKI
jgi:hypothetical protein